MTDESKISNENIKNYTFLREMYKDGFFPNHLVDKGKQILLDLCADIESTAPRDWLNFMC